MASAIWVCPRCDAVHDRDKIDGEYVKRGDCPSCATGDEHVVEAVECPTCGGKLKFDSDGHGVECLDCGTANHRVVQCTNCALDLLSENALMIDGKPFCDEFCRDHYAEECEVIPLAAGLHRDGMIHIYVDGKDSGMRIGRNVAGTGLIVETNKPLEVI